jgi:F-type H+-transporting ATPase subunit delta
MINESLARRYATAIFSLAGEAGKLEAVGDQLRGAAQLIAGDEELRRFYLSPVVQRSEKMGVIRNAFEGKVDDIVCHTLLLLIKKKREGYVPGISQQYDEMLLASQKREPLEIVTARPIGAAELTQIVDRLSKKYGRTFEVKSSVDPALYAGIKITMGDRFIDGSLSGKLQELARELFANV